MLVVTSDDESFPVRRADLAKSSPLGRRIDRTDGTSTYNSLGRGPKVSKAVAHAAGE